MIAYDILIPLVNLFIAALLIPMIVLFVLNAIYNLSNHSRNVNKIALFFLVLNVVAIFSLPYVNNIFLKIIIMFSLMVMNIPFWIGIYRPDFDRNHFFSLYQLYPALPVMTLILIFTLSCLDNSTSCFDSTNTSLIYFYYLIFCSVIITSFATYNVMILHENTDNKYLPLN